MISAVFDTNVLASGFVSHVGIPGQLLFLWSYGAFELVVSEHILTELERTFQDRYFQKRLTPEQRAADVTLLRREATVAAVTAVVRGIATHPEDDLVLAAAVSSKADFLVSGDTKLQRLGEYQAVRIVGPRAFLATLEP